MGARRLEIAIAILIGLAGGRAHAGDRELARQRYLTGTMLYERGRYSDALVELERGNQADPRPEFDYNIGLCLEKLGRAAEAASAYERFLAARPHDRDADVLRANVERLRRSAAAPSIVAAPSPMKAAPSTSAVEPSPTAVAAAEKQPFGAPGSIADAFAADVRPPSFVRSTRGRATIAIAAIGGAAFLTAAITGGVALSDRDRYRTDCAAGGCDDATYDAGRRLAVATDVLLAVGVGAAVTATLVGVSWRRERRLAIAPSASAHAASLTVTGAF